MSGQADLVLTIGWKGTISMRATKDYIKGYWDARREGLGEKAVIEWLFHIAIDNLATAFRMSSKSFSYGPKTYNRMEFGFGRSGYIHCEFDRVDEEDLHFIFEEESEEDYW